MALKLFIDGKPKTAPIEWKDTQIKAAYGTNTNQPSICLLYTSPSPRDRQKSRMPSSA